MGTLSSAEARGTSPPRAAARAALEECYRLGLWQKALEILAEMKLERALEPRPQDLPAHESLSNCQLEMKRQCPVMGVS